MKKTILVLEEDVSFWNNYNHLFLKDHFHIIRSTNFANAVEFIKSVKIDLIVCDTDLPHGSSLKLLDHLKQGFSELPVIVITDSLIPSHQMIFTDAFAFVPKIQIQEKLPKLIEKESQVWVVAGK